MSKIQTKGRHLMILKMASFMGQTQRGNPQVYWIFILILKMLLYHSADQAEQCWTQVGAQAVTYTFLTPFEGGLPLLFLKVSRVILHWCLVFSSLDFSATLRTKTASRCLVLSMNEFTALANLLSSTSVQMKHYPKSKAKIVEYIESTWLQAIINLLCSWFHLKIYI